MKKIIILSVLAPVSFFAKAQTSKNNWLIGGGIAFTSTSETISGDATGSSNSTSFALLPTAGYFFMNNLAAGVSLTFTSNHSSSSSSSTTNSDTYFTAGPFVRYYFNLSPHSKFFLHGDASWGSSKSSYTIGGNDASSPASPINIYDGKAGVAIFLNRNAALEFTAGYQSLTVKVEDGGITAKEVSNSIVLGIGFQLYLGSAKK